MNLKTEINAIDGRQDLIITRIFNLPAALVYKAYTTPELLEQWMGTKVIKLENKKHGSYELETTYEGKIVFKANGTIHEVIQDKRIVRTFEMENMAIGAQLEFLEFIELNTETSQLKIHIIYQSEAHRAEQLKLPFAYGLNMAHNKLQNINFK